MHQLSDKRALRSGIALTVFAGFLVCLLYYATPVMAIVIPQTNLPAPMLQ